MPRPMPPHYSFRPLVRDQHTAARAYFLCVLGMLAVESMLRLPGYLLNLRKRGNPPARRSRNHWAPYVALHKLLTQPSPAPFLTSHHVASIGRCLVFVGLNILWGWNRIRFTTDYQVYGWLTIANAGLALLLPTRTNVFSLVTRIPAPILLMYHRWAGVAAVIHASLHFGLTAQKYVETNQFDIVLQNTRIRIGILAWAALCVMFLTSLRILRRRTFELFYYTHFLFLVFVAGALYHAASGPEFLLPGLCLWAVDRAVRFCYSFRRVAIQSITHHAGGVVKLKFEGVKTASAAQIAWIQLPGVSRANWHPFTIASAPGSEMGTIAIRALGGYTKKVQRILDSDEDGDPAPAMAMATGQASPCTSSSQQTRLPTGRFKMRLDGPYGVGRLHWTRYPIVVIVAGGIGITPGISIAAHVVKEAASRACFRDDRWEIYLLWSLSERSHASWFEEDLKKLVSLASRPDVPVSLDISIHVTGRKALGKEVAAQQEHEMEERAGYAGPGTFHKGRPDLMRWFQHIREGRPGRDAAVSVCGPQSLKNDARRAAARASSKEGLFFVEEEVFEF